MKVIFVAVVVMLAIVAVSADCGCLKCSKNLYVASAPTSPVQVIYRGTTCSCNRQIPYTVEQPIIAAKSCPTLRQSTYKMIPLKIVKKAVVKPTPSYSYDYQVQVPVPVEEKRCNKCLVGLIAQPDRVVLPAPSCRQQLPSNPSRGPVFEALTPSEEDDYIYQYQPAKKCGCGRYSDLKACHIQNRLGACCNDGYRDLTQQEVDDNISRNIKDIFFENTFEGKVRRLFFAGLGKLQSLQPIQKDACPANFSLSLGKINFDPARRSRRSINPSQLVKKKPFLAPQRKAASKTISTQIESSTRRKRSLDDLTFTYEDSNELPHSHDESDENSSKEQIDSFQNFDDDEEIEMVSSSKASHLLLNTIHLDQLLPQVPLLFLVNAPISMLAQFHRLNKHFQPVVESVPSVIQTSRKYFIDFGEKFKRSFYVFANCLLSNVEEIARIKRSLDDGGKKKILGGIGNYEVLKCKVNLDGTVDFVLFNRKSDRKLRNIAVVIENFKGSQAEGKKEQVYLAKVDTTSLMDTGKKLKRKDRAKRTKRDIFEVDLNGDIQDLIIEKWGRLVEEQTAQHQQSAESIFEDHFNQIPTFYNAAKKTSYILQKSSPKKSVSKLKPDPILGSSNHYSKTPKDFSDLHPEKNLDIIKQSIGTVLVRLQDLLRADIVIDLKYYEDLVKLQYLKNVLVVDWRKYLGGDKKKIVTAKMNILNYVKELERFRKSLSKKTVDRLLKQHGDGYNRSDLVQLLVELYKLQMIFTRIYEDLNDKINLGSRFNQQSEETFIKQLERVQFVEKSNKFELEQRLKEMRDAKVEANMKFLEKLRKLIELESSVEMDHDAREELHHTARMIKENAHYKVEELKQVKEIGRKVRTNQSYRKELKNLWDLDRHILNNEEELAKRFTRKSDLEEKVQEEEGKEKEEDDTFDILKMANPLGITLKPLDLKELKVLSDLKSLEWDTELKSKMHEFTKDVEQKRKAWVKKTKKLAEIIKEP